MNRSNARQFRTSIAQRMKWYEESDGSDDDESVNTASQVNTVSPEEEKILRMQAIKAFQKFNFPQKYKAYQLIGVYEATKENAISLVANGPDKNKVGTGSGLGKGRGFYVTPSKALCDLPYGECILAVYIQKVAERRTSAGCDTVEAAERAYAEEFEEPANTPCYYVMGGGGEIVVPERCFELVKLAKDLSDLQKW